MILCIWNIVHRNSAKITKMYSHTFQIKSSKIAMTMLGCVFLYSIHFGPLLTNLPLFRMANLDALLYKCRQSTETDATKISKTLKTVKRIINLNRFFTWYLSAAFRAGMRTMSCPGYATCLFSKIFVNKKKWVYSV